MPETPPVFAGLMLALGVAALMDAAMRRLGINLRATA